MNLWRLVVRYVHFVVFIACFIAIRFCEVILPPQHPAPASQSTSPSVAPHR